MSSLQSVDELPIFLFPLDKDVISLEQDCAFREFKMDNDPSGTYNIAKAVVYLQKTFGVPSKIFGLGNAAKEVHEHIQTVKQETGPFKPQVGKCWLKNPYFCLFIFIFFWAGFWCQH